MVLPFANLSGDAAQEFFSDGMTEEIAAALASSDVREKLKAQGVDPVGNTPREFAGVISTEIVKWRGVVKAAGTPIE